MATKEVKDESKEAPADEMKETPAKEEKEVKEGTEESGSVAIPEEFQVQASALVNSCSSRPCLDFLRSLVSKKEDELREADMARRESKSGKGKKIPSEFSSAAMPSY